MIKTLFFAELADDAGCGSIEMAHSADLTARKLVSLLESEIKAAAIEKLRHDFVLLSVNQKMAGWDEVLDDGDEVAFLPPFSGG